MSRSRRMGMKKRAGREKEMVVERGKYSPPF
jgi:hypothetical protein